MFKLLIHFTPPSGLRSKLLSEANNLHLTVPGAERGKRKIFRLINFPPKRFETVEYWVMPEQMKGKKTKMETLTVLTENMEETASLLKEALAKEKYLLQLGIEKTQARIRQFEQQYSATLTQILDKEQNIDHTALAEWEGEVEVLRRLMKKIQNLEQIEICI